MNKKRARYIFKNIFLEVENMRCEHLHHKHNQYHESGYMCPAEYERQKWVYEAREILSELGLDIK